jgi:hypothetical protein
MPKKLSKIHSEALRIFDDIQSTVREEREQCLEDRRFVSIAGAQWEGDLGDQFENKPKFEVNKVELSCMRIYNEYRNNRITVDFIPKDGKDDSLADVCDGRYRADEEDSGAQEAKDNAYDEAVAGGFGAWRLKAVYEDEEDDENEYQRIAFEPIFDADNTVFFSLNAKRQDKADADRCFVINPLPRDTYTEEYGDSPSDWPKEIMDTEFDWSTPDVVYVAEYYVVERMPYTVQIWEGMDGNEQRYVNEDFENDPNLFEMLTATGSRKVREKKVHKKRVHKYILNGSRVLEDCGYIAGSCIPIVPMYGKRWYVDNVERCKGHVRNAKDAQRLKNMQVSKLGEISALSSVEKPILTPDQVAGHEYMWSVDNIKNWPYLLLNSIIDQNGNISPSGPVGYTRSPNVPPAMAALLQMTETDIQDILGNQQAAEEVVPNISGKAVELIQNRLDMQSFIYISNMAKAEKRSGEIWLSMARDLYVEDNRNLKILGQQKEAESIELMKPVINEETGAIEYENDFKNAKYDLVCSIGPSTSSKRNASVRALTAMLQMTADPQDQAVITAMAMMNMEGEGIEEVRKFYRKKLVSMGVLEPTEQEQEQIAAAQAAEQQPGPEQQYLSALANEAMADAQKAQADTMLAAAKAEKTKAETAETLSKMSREEQQSTVKTVKDLTETQNIMNQPATMPP